MFGDDSSMTGNPYPSDASQAWAEVRRVSKERDAALGQVAALREALGELPAAMPDSFGDDFEMPVRGKAMRMAWRALTDTEAATREWEARVRAEERERLAAEFSREAYRLINGRIVTDAIRALAPAAPKPEGT